MGNWLGRNRCGGWVWGGSDTTDSEIRDGDTLVEKTEGVYLLLHFNPVLKIGLF